MNIYEFSDAQEQAKKLAESVASDLRQALDVKETATLVVPGGATPKLFFNELSCYSLDWSRVIVLLTDERWVPFEDPLSNEALLATELQRGSAQSLKLISFYQDQSSIEEVVERFNQSLQDYLPFDVCILGMGDDGHTASLFPQMTGLTIALNKYESPSLLVAHVANKNEQRVTFNLSALLTATSHYLLIKGEVKKKVLDEANKRPVIKFPVSYLLSATPVDVYYCDN